MKLKNCHICFDFNRDTVSIVHRPGDGSPIEVKPDTNGFIHSMLQWLQEADLGHGPVPRLVRRIFRAVFGHSYFTRVVIGPDGRKYTIKLTIKEASKKPSKEKSNAQAQEEPGQASDDHQ